MLVTTTKVHLNDGTYINPGGEVPLDPSDESIAELLRSGAIVEGEPDPNVPPGDITKIIAHVRLEKYNGDDPDARALDPAMDPDDVIESSDNLLMIGGASAFWERLKGTSIAAFDNTNAHLGVGDSNTTVSDTQTDLQATTNKLRRVMDATYPTHTDSTSSAGAKDCVFKATFASGDANWPWREWALFNASSAGRMLNRKAEDLGTKTSASAWVLTITLSLA